ncbi:TolC family protein [Chitinophaga sp. RAB17]|uniref:TolC family protein n=1 Tax=Chitinophaga sp. RAB17 TaxID=3233049 RepID=UPI003F902A2A
MSFSKSTLLFVTLLVYGQLSYGQAQMDLDECIKMALANNPAVAKSALRESVSRINLENIRAARLPSLNLTFSGTKQYGRSVDPFTNGFTNNSYLYQNSFLQSQMTLFNWGKIRSDIAASAAGLEMMRYQKKYAELEVKMAVIAAYLDLLLVNDQARLSARRLAGMEEQLRIMKNLVEAGKRAELSVMQLNGELLKDSARVKDYQIQRAEKKAVLRKLMFMDGTTEFEISDHLPEMAQVTGSAETSSVEHIIETNSSNKMHQMQIRQAELSIRSIRSSRYPNIYFNGQLSSYFSDTYRNPDGKIIGYQRQVLNNFSSYAGISVSLPIFANRNLVSNYRRAKINLEMEKINQQENKMEIAEKLKLLEEKVAGAAAQNELLYKGSQLMDSVLSNMKFGLQKGNITTTEFLDVQQQYYATIQEQRMVMCQYLFYSLILREYRSESEEKL